MSFLPDLYSEDVLIERLLHSARSRQRKVIFLIGSAAASGSGDSPGVPDVNGVISLIRNEFSSKAASLKDFNLFVRRSKKPYQAAFQFLLGRRGQDVANSIIKKAVIAAYKGSPLQKGGEMSDEICEDLESVHDNWHLPEAIGALGEIATNYPSIFGRRILTSNFDPLIEIGICAARGTFYRTVLSGDGSVANTSGQGCNVVHFHGHWYGSDTLHTPTQLSRARPQLVNSLSSLLANSTVVVVGYGGWDDIFYQAILNVASNESYSPDILWTFLSNDRKKIEAQYGEAIHRFEPVISRSRFSLYVGVDCHKFFPRLLRELDREVGRSSQTVNEDIDEANYADNAIPNTDRLQRRKTDLVRINAQLSDSPPRVDAWVGRNKEIEILRNVQSPVVVISGIGGQGKSALAATYLKFAVDNGSEYELWDWRDSKEQGDRIGTQLSLIIERLSGGSVRADEVEGQDIESVTDVFFNVLGNRRCLFIFDNVDHYVDLEDFRPVGAFDVLLKKAASRQHSSRFVFTCRPNIQVSNPGILPIHLKDGLSDEEARHLFQMRGVDTKNNIANIDEANHLTGGHPLWLNLIAVQVAGGAYHNATDTSQN